jgi:glycosyltransferase involved in cell wall biosynthesis
LTDILKRLAHISSQLAAGGLEQLIVRWSNARNVTIPGSTSVYCLDKKGEMAEQLDPYRIRCADAQRARFPWDREAVKKLAEFCVEDRIEVIHSHNMAAWQYGALLSRATGIPHVYTQHGANIHNLGLVNRLRSKILLRWTDAVVAVSDQTADSIVKNQGIARKRIQVIHNGVEMPRIADKNELYQLRTRIGLPENSVVLGSVGRLAKVKGWDRFLPVFAELLHQGGMKNLYLLLVGDGSERENIEKLSSELNIHNKIRLSGYQTDPIPYLRLMDYFLLPSYSEGLSVALLEAMACGIPAIVTDVGHSRQIVEDSGAGLVLPESRTKWAQCILQAISSSRGLQNSKMIEYVRENYSQRATLEKYESVYSTLFNAQR